MKKRNDPRHLHRISLMQKLFTWDFQKKDSQAQEVAAILDHLPEIDQLVQEAAPSRPLDQINKIDLAILRLAVFEVIIEKDAPIKVTIDEAIELGKEYGGDSSASFINGVLGKIVENKQLTTEEIGKFTKK